ncbi:helix-turn-helix domain-containing protein [Streptomyces sp. NPDC056672]|uniref:nSTAND1 domain-containing NTPase n=1 Tax=Streptomyces sp. NPDC056672 TaxID=3345906 RepID=UPI0036CCC135
MAAVAGRREVPVDPGAGPVQRFAFELRKLRTEADGLTYRAMAQRAGYSITTLSQAAAGEQLPTLPVVLAYAEACGGNSGEWEARWREASTEAAALAAEDGTGNPDPPYRGLARYETGDSGRFFGREQLTSDLVDLLHRERFAAVFGPSGSGKSSVLRAGVIPALQHPEDGSARLAAIRVLTPGDRPFRNQAHLLTPKDASADTLVVVDQFEEVFTLCKDPAERAAFIDLLLAARRTGSRLRLLIAVRADFYGRCAEHRDLADALRDTSVLVGPMTPDELREAVVKPAAARGLTVERPLTARLVDEVAGQPGGLPLMSHVLLETWRRRRGGKLTLEGYQAAGGLNGAVAQTAEDVYTRLSPQQAETARSVLLRLVTPGDGTPDTRRLVQRRELDTAHDPQQAGQIIEDLARARLLTLDDDTVDLAHEALLTGWPRFHGWIEDARDRLRLHRRLTDDATAWTGTGRDPSALYRGNRLAAAEEQLTALDLNTVERSFLAAGITARDRERCAAARATRRLRRLWTAVAVATVLITLASLIMWQQNQSQERERIRAEARRIAALADRLRATDPQTAMRLSLASWTLADLPETRSALMSAAVQPEQNAFTDPDGSPGTMRYLSADGRTVLSVGARRTVQWDVRTRRRIASFPGLGANLAHAGVMSPDSRKLTLLNSDGSVSVWNVRAGRVDREAVPADGGAEMSPSGRTLVLYRTTGPQPVVQLRNMQTGHLLLEHRMTSLLPETGAGEPYDIPGWSIQRLYRQRAMVGYPFPDAQISADDQLMALCLPGARVQLWDIPRRRALPTVPKLTAAAGNCTREDIQFTPDSRYLVLRGPAGIRRWDIASGRELPRIQHQGLRNLDFSADGTFMTATDSDEILLWRTGTPAVPVFRYPLSDEVVSELHLDTTEQQIRYFAGRSQTIVRSLSLDGIIDSRWHQEPATAAAFSPDGSALAIAYQDTATGQAQIRLRHGRSGSHMTELPPAPCPTPPEDMKEFAPCPIHMAFRADGRVLAYGVSDPTTSLPGEKIYLWNIRTRQLTGSLPVTRNHPKSYGMPGNAVDGIAFHPDGTSLMTSRIPQAERIEFWDLRRRTMTRELPGAGGRNLAVKPGGRVMATDLGQFIDLRSGRITQRALTPGITTALTFSPDGGYLAAGDESGQVTIWDGDAHRPLGVLPATPARGTDSRPVSDVAFSPDGRTLAAAGKDGTLRLWNTQAGRPLGTPLPTAGDTLLSLAFSPDGKTLYAAGKHTQLQKYALSPERTAAQVCHRLAAGPSQAEWQAHIPDIPYRHTC